jgi:hypothetical protein
VPHSRTLRWVGFTRTRPGTTPLLSPSNTHKTSVILSTAKNPRICTCGCLFSPASHQSSGAPFIAHFAMGGITRTRPGTTPLLSPSNTHKTSVILSTAKNPRICLCGCLFSPASHQSSGAPFIAHFAMGGITRTRPGNTHKTFVILSTAKNPRISLLPLLLPLPLGLELGFSPASRQAAKRPPLCRRPGRSPKGEATHSIAVAVAVIFLLPSSAQKSHVKPPNHLTHYPTTTSTWHFSSPQTAILDIEIKNKQAPWGYRRPPGLTH